MKRILVFVVTFLMSASLFAVTGEVFTKVSGGTISVGDTGFKLNYDAFGIEYKLRTKANVLGVDAYSPGYINITGIKAGMLTLGMGLTTYLGYDNIKVTSFSNGTKNLDEKKFPFAYSIDILPRIALNIGTMNVTTSDQSQIYWAESIQREMKLSNNNSNVVEDTDARVDSRELRVKIGANMKGLWNGELGGYNNAHWTWKQSLAIYEQKFDNELNTWGDFTLPLGSDMDLYVKGWFKWTTYDNMSKLVIPGVTNISGNRGTEIMFGPEVRVQYKIAGGQVKLNLGIGLASQLYQQSFDYVTMLNNNNTNIVTTNNINSWYVLYGVKRDDDRALLEFGGSTKFADWEFGMTGRLTLAIPILDRSEDPNAKTVSERWFNDQAVWGENLFVPVVKDLYFKYSKGMFSAKFNVGTLGTAAASSAWFNSVELSYKF